MHVNLPELADHDQLRREARLPRPVVAKTQGFENGARPVQITGVDDDVEVAVLSRLAS